MNTIDPRDSSKPPSDADGAAYGRMPGHHNAKLTEVGAGTPCGEYLRRYWHPIAIGAKVGRRPQKVRLLGEDLILFRDGKDRCGLLYPRCTHRGSSLYYGRTEERGIRCCYHGWLFDTEGRVLEQPCEEDGGRHRDRVRQPWYPVQERYGLVFAYMGPPEKKPVLPRFDVLENLAPGHHVFPHGNIGISGYADAAAGIGQIGVPYNWLQVFENGLDPFHVWILHSNFSDYPQFGDSYKPRPRVEFHPTKNSILNHAIIPFEGKTLDQVEELVLPNIKSLYSMDQKEGRARRVGWNVPVDDTHFINFGATVGTERLKEFDALVMTPDGKTWSQMSEEEHQDFPGDFEAQGSQGPITLHSEEHLFGSDKGVIMLRKMLLREIDAVAAGKDPAGVAFTEEDALVRIGAGNFYS